MKAHSSLIAAALACGLLAAPGSALSQTTGDVQGWFSYGRVLPDLKGPAPRLPNGKPSMAGMWTQTRRADVTDPRGQPGYVKELPFTDWGKRQWETYDPNVQGDYTGSCLPFGMSRTVFGPWPIQFIQDDDKMVMLAEQNTWFHIIYADGRPHDPELPPTWWGDSVGHWEGDTLVVVTKNMNGYIKVDTIGHPLSSMATITQTFKRANLGTIEHTITYDDPKTYTGPWTVSNTWRLAPFNQKVLEYSCEEGNLDNLLNGVITPWKRPEGEDAP